MKQTLCWTCKRPGTRSCAWDDSKGEIPVNGWTAEQVQWTYTEGYRYGGRKKTFKRIVTSYRVLDCPAFIPDGKPCACTTSNYIPAWHRERAKNLILNGAGAQKIMQEFGVTESTAKIWIRKALNQPVKRRRKRKEEAG